MGGDSCSGGRGFESQRSILDGHFHIDLLFYKEPKMKEKEAKI